MNLPASEQLLSELYAQPDRVQTYFSELERLISECMDEVYRLAQTGEDDVLKMRHVAIEYKARLLIERYRKGCNN